MNPGDSFNVEVSESHEHWFIAPKYRPRPSGREVYGHSKRFDAHQRQEEERQGIDWEAARRAFAEVAERRAEEERAAAAAAAEAAEDRRFWDEFHRSRREHNADD